MLLEAKDIRVSFRKENQTKLFGRERQEVLHGLSIELEEGECLGIIGESGSGKSTFGRVLSGLLAPDSGEVRLDGVSLYGRHTREERAKIEQGISIVFQDYTTSANPRFRVQGIIGESFRARRLKGERITKEEQKRRTIELLERVGLNESFLTRYPHELSGGQLQRVCIARAVALHPRFILLDEAISSLDAATQIQVMDLLKDLRRDFNLSYVFITHDLTAITYFCDRVRFLHNGSFVEEVDDMRRISKIKNPYAQDLLKAVMGIGVHYAPDAEAEARMERDEEVGAEHGSTLHVEQQAYF